MLPVSSAPRASRPIRILLLLVPNALRANRPTRVAVILAMSPPAPLMEAVAPLLACSMRAVSPLATRLIHAMALRPNFTPRTVAPCRHLPLLTLMMLTRLRPARVNARHSPKPALLAMEGVISPLIVDPGMLQAALPARFRGCDYLSRFLFC